MSTETDEILAQTRRSICVTGQGLLGGHGIEVALVALPTGSRQGIQWFDTVNPWDISMDARRSTVLTHRPSGYELRTPEHLSAAALGWPGCGTLLQATEGDIPILDGSAQPWISVLQELHGPPVGAITLYGAPLHARHSWNEGYWEIEPSAGGTFEVEYSIDRLGYVASHRMEIADFHTLSAVLSARTFIFEEDFAKAMAAGLLPGACEGSGLLLRGRGSDVPEVLSGNALRHPNEPVLHKILDLLGDLALLGPFLPKLLVRIHNGGHVAHQQILTRLKPYVPTRYAS